MRGKVRSLIGHPNLILETMPEVCEEKGWKFASRPGKFHQDNEWSEAGCLISGKGFRATFALQQMPGCCAVLTASYIEPNPYTKDVFKEVIETISEATYRAGFGSLILTQVVRKEFPVEKHIWSSLLQDNFEMSKPFINAKSGNQVVYLTRDMQQLGKRDGMEINYVG